MDLHSASAPLLTRVAGVSATVAGNIVAYRDEHGAFSTRKELGKVPRLGPKAFQQCAGFLRIGDGPEPLDASAVHPEAYPVVERIAAAQGCAVADLIGNTRLLKGLRPQDYADDTFGIPTVTDIIAELDKPGRDPRPEFATATFKEGVEKVSDLQPGMILEGTVSNVAAFGAFVDVGVHQDGLVHVSAMSKSYVPDPRDVVRSGQVVRVKVLEVDVQRKRISLSLRLDDEPGGAPGEKPAGKGQRGGRGGKPARAGKDSRQRGRRQRGGEANSSGGSMADALKRAGFGG